MQIEDFYFVWDKGKYDPNNFAGQEYINRGLLKYDYYGGWFPLPAIFNRDRWHFSMIKTKQQFVTKIKTYEIS